MKVVFVRTPRYVWPFNSETSAFWQPLGFMSLAAQLEAFSPDWSARILDCPGSKMGWKTLFSTLHANWPDVICVGEETVSSTEALRLARTVKKQRPERHHKLRHPFSHLPASYSHKPAWYEA